MTLGDLRDPLTCRRLLPMAYRNSVEGGMKWRGAIKGEFVRWTNLSRSLDTHPLKVFIMKSIIFFIICILATMCGGAVFMMDKRLVSCRSCLLGALLPSSPSLSLLSVLVPSCFSLWLLGPASLCCSCSSKSWFCLVRCSTTAARVCTYLSRAVVHGSSILLVAIEWVSLMQLFIWEAVVWPLVYFLPHKWHQLMMPKILRKPHCPHMP